MEAHADQHRLEGTRSTIQASQHWIGGMGIFVAAILPEVRVHTWFLIALQKCCVASVGEIEVQVTRLVNLGALCGDILRFHVSPGNVRPGQQKYGVAFDVVAHEAKQRNDRPSGGYEEHCCSRPLYHSIEVVPYLSCIAKPQTSETNAKSIWL